MDEKTKRIKLAKKRTRHEATKKRTRKHKMVEANSEQHKLRVPPASVELTGSHEDFMKKKRR